MKTTMLRRARALWNNPAVSRRTNRVNQLRWARAMATLGEKWLFATPVQRR